MIGERLNDCPVYEPMLRYGELEIIARQFILVVERRHPGKPFRLALEPYPNAFLNSVGDRLLVAYEAEEMNQSIPMLEAPK